MKIRVVMRDSNVPEATKVRYKIKVRVVSKKKLTFSSKLINNLKSLLNK